MKKIMLLAVFFLFFGLASHAVAQGFVPLAEIKGLTDPTTANGVTSNGTIGADSFALFFNNLYKFLLGLAITLAIIEIIWGGLEYSTTDSIGNKEAGKTRIRNAIYGLILILSPVLVFSIINPCILNLSIALTPITLTPVGGSGEGSGSCK